MARKGKWSSIRRGAKYRAKKQDRTKIQYKDGKEGVYDSNGNKIYL